MNRIFGWGLALICALALGCSDEDPRREAGAGGDGGTGGAGGTAGTGGDETAEERIRELCDRTCSAMASCGQAGVDDACSDRCVDRPAPVALLDRCASCWERFDCSGARLACARGPDCELAFDLRVSGSRLDAFEGKRARILLAEAVPGEHWVDEAREVTIEGGGFDVTLARSLAVAWSIPFNVAVVIDGDGDGACRLGSADRIARVGLGVPVDDLHIRFEGSDFAPVTDCGLWEAAPDPIVLQGQGLAEHEGKWVIAASVWVDPTFISFGELHALPIADGGFRAELGDFGDYVEEMAPDSEIRAAWMIDLDGDWICSPADAGGSVPVSAQAGFERLAIALPSEPGTAPCGLFRGVGHTLVLEGEGYDRFEGAPVELALLDPQGRVVRYARGPVEAGTFRLSFEHLLVPGLAYDLAVWIDADESKSCGEGDHLQRVAVGMVDGDTTRPVPLDEGEPDFSLCDLYLTAR